MAQEDGVIDGLVSNGTAGAAPPADVEVVVHILQNRAKTGERRVRTDATGAFHVDGLTTGGADAVLAASIFHYGEHTIGDAKAFLLRHGVAVRQV